VSDEPEFGRAKPAPERFEMLETDATAHLTEEQKGWKKVKLRPPAERFAVLTPTGTPASAAAQAAAELTAVVNRMLALGAAPEAITKVVADALAARA
jgi:hypothetical protein